MNLSDARVRNTRQMIRKNFLAILRQKPVSKISVTELCSVCEINRATFYHHYADVYDLLDSLEREVLDEVTKMLDLQSGQTMHAIFLQALCTMRDARSDWWVLGSEHGDPGLFTKMFSAVYETSFPRIQQKAAALPAQTQTLLYRYLAQGSGGVIRQWLQSGAGTPPEELADFLMHATDLLMGGFIHSAPFTDS